MNTFSTSRGFTFQRSFFQYFYVRLAGILLLVLLALGAIQLFLFSYYWGAFTDETKQLVNTEFADRIGQELQPLLTPTIDYYELQESLYSLEQKFTQFSFFILKADGTIFFHLHNIAKIKKERIQIGPIQTFLEPSSDEHFPLYGEDPMSNDRNEVFSVAPVSLGNEPGYLYVLLGSSSERARINFLSSSYVFGGTLAIIFFTIIGAGISGTILFSYLTRPLRKLTETVTEFENGNRNVRIEETSNDEIGTVSAAFNNMADTIDANIKEIERNDELRRELVANVAHDLRGPVTSIFGFLEMLLLKEDLPAEKTKRYHELAFNNTATLKQMIDDLFELSKLEAQDISVSATTFSLQELVAESIDQFQNKAEKAEVVLRKSVPIETAMVTADKKLLVRVFSNLIGNAINYTESGGEVCVEVETNEKHAIIRVRDTGIGIAESDVPKVFDRFFRAEQTGAKFSPGTGLGLAIVKRILDAHKSDIQVTSVLGEGTTFEFQLPLAGAYTNGQ